MVQQTTGIVLSDIDGTIVKGSLVLNHASFLNRIGKISVSEELKAWRNSPKNESRIVDLAEAYREQLRGAKFEELRVERFINDLIKKNRFYSSLKRLLRYKSRGWPVHLISGSPHFLVQPFAEAFGFEGQGSVYEVCDQGALTGGVQLMAHSAAKHNHLSTLDLGQYKRIVAFGDTASDKPLFDVAHHSVLVAPNRATRKALKVNEIITE